MVPGKTRHWHCEVMCVRKTNLAPTRGRAVTAESALMCAMTDRLYPVIHRGDGDLAVEGVVAVRPPGTAAHRGTWVYFLPGTAMSQCRSHL